MAVPVCLSLFLALALALQRCCRPRSPAQGFAMAWQNWAAAARACFAGFRLPVVDAAAVTAPEAAASEALPVALLAPLVVQLCVALHLEEDEEGKKRKTTE